MGLQFSASRADLFVKCARPFAEATPIAPFEATEVMLWGSAVHGIVEHEIKGEGGQGAAIEVCARFGVQDVAGAQMHAGVALAALRRWCVAEHNPFGVDFRIMYSEVPLATRMSTGRTRVCGFDQEAHRYELEPGEFAGTFDMVLTSNLINIVVDLKTGDYGVWVYPGDLGQMKTLVLQCRGWRATKRARWGAAILHAPREGIPVIYCDEVAEEASKKHLKVLQEANKRVGDGSLTPGDQCFSCPAKEGCPANDGELLARCGAIVKASSTELAREAITPGEFHMYATELEKLLKRGREIIKEKVREGALYQRPDGKALAIRSHEEEGLSKATIVRALGKEEGEKLIEELRAKGVVEKRTKESLVAENDK